MFYTINFLLRPSLGFVSVRIRSRENPTENGIVGLKIESLDRNHFARDVEVGF